ncbi:MAG: Alpha/Beta hydrolase protein [Monoraphidium minutum]|nr:MAG: Alpha/Beta hydrolase protein [Monoraphidium minutum]
MAAAEVKELSFTNNRGQQLFAIELLPPQPKAVIIWAHGHGEHCRRKLAVFRAWAASGIAVFAFDAHGFGASEPADPRQRGLVQSMSHLVDDMADFAAYVDREHKSLDPLPWFAGGYSMGGVVAALTVMRWQEQWAGLVLFAPALGVHLSPWMRLQKFIGPCLDCAAPGARVSQPVEPADLNPDPEAIAEYTADPLCSSGPMAIRTAFQYSKGQDALELMAPKIMVPLYCEHSQGDTLAQWEASREFCACVGTEDVTWLAPEGGCHDELSGKRAPQVAARMAEWMLKKAQAPPKGESKGANASPAK